MPGSLPREARRSGCCLSRAPTTSICSASGVKVKQLPIAPRPSCAKKRFDATLIHTHTFDMTDLPEALRYAKDRVEGAIKVVVKNKHAAARQVAAE